jgi:hypothetical protein
MNRIATTAIVISKMQKSHTLLISLGLKLFLIRFLKHVRLVGLEKLPGLSVHFFSCHMVSCFIVRCEFF